jgi:hypothetical protein
MRSMRFVCRLALPVVILVGAAGLAAAQAPDVQQACTPDAMRLCGAYLLDPRSVEACLRAAGPRLSQPCYDVFFPPQAAASAPPPLRGSPPPKGSRKRPPPPLPQDDED